MSTQAIQRKENKYDCDSKYLENQLNEPFKFQNILKKKKKIKMAVNVSDKIQSRTSHLTDAENFYFLLRSTFSRFFFSFLFFFYILITF